MYIVFGNYNCQIFANETLVKYRHCGSENHKDCSVKSPANLHSTDHLCPQFTTLNYPSLSRPKFPTTSSFPVLSTSNLQQQFTLPSAPEAESHESLGTNVNSGPQVTLSTPITTEVLGEPMQLVSESERNTIDNYSNETSADVLGPSDNSMVAPATPIILIHNNEVTNVGQVTVDTHDTLESLETETTPHTGETRTSHHETERNFELPANDMDKRTQEKVEQKSSKVQEQAKRGQKST